MGGWVFPRASLNVTAVACYPNPSPYLMTEALKYRGTNLVNTIKAP